MGKYSRNKGAAYERELVQVFREAGYPATRRNLQPQGGQAVGGDIEGLPWAIEAARRSKRLIWSDVVGKKMAQAIRDETHLAATRGRPPRPALVVVRQDGGESLVVLSLADFLTITGEKDAEPSLD